jgi:hypothetical protein
VAVEGENSGGVEVSTEGGVSKRQKVQPAEGDSAARKATEKENRPDVPKQGGTADPKPASKSLPFKATTNKHGGSSALLLYNVPVNVPLQHLHSLFHSSAGIVPWMLRAPELTEKAGHYKTIAYFQSVAHADLAFKTIKGPVNTEIYGLLQKPMYLGEAYNNNISLRKTNWPWLVEKADGAAEGC